MYWFAVLFKAFWDISTDISFNVSANGRKQTNLLPFSPTFSLFLFESLLSSLCVALHPFLASFLFLFPLLSMLLQGTSFSFKLPSVCPLNTTKACTDKLSMHWGFFSLLELNLVYNSIFSTSVHAKSKKKNNPKTLKKICSYSTVQSKVTPDFFLFCVQEARFSFNVVLNNSSPGFLEVSQRFSLDCGCCFIYFHSYSFT